MGRNTGIQWCDSTVNPTSGCDGCELWDAGGKRRLCYAGRLHETRLARAHPDLYAPTFTEVRHDARMMQRMNRAAAWPDLRGKRRPGKPWLDGRPRLIFVSDMADAFSRAVPFHYLAGAMDRIIGDAGRRHFWLWVTKQPARAAAFFRWWCGETGRDAPDNLMLLTSVTSPATRARIDDLLAAPVNWRGLSIEPVLAGPIDLRPWLSAPDAADGSPGRNPRVDWVLVGGASRQGAEAPVTDLDHIDDLIDQTTDANVPVFVKQLGARPVVRGLPPLTLGDSHGGDWREWPARLAVRRVPDGIAAMNPDDAQSPVHT